jgi:ribosomal protein S24E
MESKIISDVKNNSLNREEFVLEVVSENNPSKKDIAEVLKKDVELTVVKQIRGSFGKNKFDVEAVVYNTKVDKDKFEVTPRKVRKKAVAEKKKADEEARKAAGAK